MQLEALQHRGTSHSVALETATEADLLARQFEIKAGEFSWFIASALLDEFQDIKARLPQENQHVLVNPPSGMCLDIYNADQTPPSTWADGTVVQLYQCHGGPNQLWEFQNG